MVPLGLLIYGLERPDAGGSSSSHLFNLPGCTLIDLSFPATCLLFPSSSPRGNKAHHYALPEWMK